MAVVTPAHQKQIEAALAGGKPEAAFEIIQGYADLRHGDMPAVSKAALTAIGKNPAAVRTFVLGTSSLSISVRRFCRKYLPKVGEPAAGPTLALAAESLDPFRPGEGLIGSFGGLVSPIGRTILEQKMDFEIKPNHGYSDAGRYAKEVMDDLVFLVAATKHQNLVVFSEYVWARIEDCKALKRDWPHADFTPPWTNHTVQEILRKNAKVWGDAVVRWTAGHTLLFDETPDDPVVLELSRRAGENTPNAQARLKEAMVIQFGTNFHGLGEEHRRALYRNLRAVLPTLSPRVKPYIERSIEDYKRKYPDEAGQAEREPASATTEVHAASEPSTPKRGSKQRDDAAAEPVAATSSGGADSSGPGGQRALLTVLRLAFQARLPSLHATINKTVDKDQRDDEKPKSGGSAEDEKVIAAYHQTILQHRGKRPGTSDSTLRFGEDRTYVPQQVIENASEGVGMTDLLIRFLGTEQTYLLASAAATLLPCAGLEKFGAAWAMPNQGDLRFFDADEVLDALAERRIAPITLLHAVFTREEKEFDIALGEGWQRAIAMLYHWAGDIGRKTALDLLARYPYPKEVNEYSNRRDFHDAHLGSMWTAWQRRDAEFLALAFERFAMPYFWKGSKPMLPKREPVFTTRNYAARSDTGEGVPLADVWQLASSAGRVTATVRAALRHAELCEAPRMILDRAAPEDFADTCDDLLALLESSNPAVLGTGLGVITRAPEAVAPRAEEAVTLAARALSSTRSGAAKEAAAALAALGNAHKNVRPQACAALADGLALEAVPVLQAIMKGLKSLPAKLPGDTRARIVELVQNDPAKFEKLAKPLLAA